MKRGAIDRLVMPVQLNSVLKIPTGTSDDDLTNWRVGTVIFGSRRELQFRYRGLHRER